MIAKCCQHLPNIKAVVLPWYHMSVVPPWMMELDPLSQQLAALRRQSRRISFGDNGLPFELTNNEFVTVRCRGDGGGPVMVLGSTHQQSDDGDLLNLLLMIRETFIFMFFFKVIIDWWKGFAYFRNGHSSEFAGELPLEPFVPGGHAALLLFQQLGRKLGAAPKGWSDRVHG